MSNLPVLIVGAGPTGLMMAYELARRDIPFRIIDKKPERTLSSNATWIQTRTVEIFDHMGIADHFIKIGNPCDAINLYIEGKQLTRISLNYINSIYPYILMLAQSELERLFIEHLQKANKSVERSAELINIKQNKNSVISTIKYANGHTENITSNWLIACDGANSTVREKCCIFFPGENLSEEFIVADAQIDSYMAKNEIHVFFDRGTLFAASPLGANIYRIIANLHLPYPRKIFTEREVIEMAQERAYGIYYVNKVSWISPFWIHGKIIKNMRHNSIFFVGDAAHIHSPVGGQGMNTGLQDAYNLAWKLALVIKNKAKPSLLDSYQSERHDVVKNIVKQTENFTKLALFDKTFLTKLRKYSEKIAQNEPSFAKKIGEQITQVNIQYKKSPVIIYTRSKAIKSLQPGEYVPDVIINSSKRLYNYLRNNLHNLLLFTGSANAKELKQIKNLESWLRQNYSEHIRIHIITKENLSDVNNLIIDEDSIIHERFGVDKPFIYIIRPDNYIAYAAKNLDQTSIKKFFRLYLKDSSNR